MEKKYFISVKNTVIEGYYDETTVYIASTNDGYTTEELTKDKYDDAKKNSHNQFENGITSFVKHHGFTEEEKMRIFKSSRNLMLKNTDYLLLEDYPISSSEKIEVLAYRQKLRDSTISRKLPIKPSFL